MRTFEAICIAAGAAFLLVAGVSLWARDPSQSKELFLKGIAAVGLVVGGSIGLWKYFDTAEMQFRRPYWDKKIQVYCDASEAAATAAASTKADDRARAADRFRALYFGPMTMVEDTTVETAMVAFEVALDRFEKGEITQNALKNESLSLASTMRESIGHDWDVKLPLLRGKYKNLSGGEK
jgi:hypothetical protein